MQHTYSNWIRRADSIVKQFNYNHEGESFTFAIDCRVSQGSFAPHVFLFFWIDPSIRYEGLGQIILAREQTGENSGWCICQIGESAKNQTIINATDPQVFRKIFSFFQETGHFVFTLNVNNEDVIRLPIEINESIDDLYLEIANEFRR